MILLFTLIDNAKSIPPPPGSLLKRNCRGHSRLMKSRKEDNNTDLRCHRDCSYNEIAEGIHGLWESEKGRHTDLRCHRDRLITKFPEFGPYEKQRRKQQYGSLPQGSLL